MLVRRFRCLLWWDRTEEITRPSNIHKNKWYLSVFLKDAQELATIGKELLWWGGSGGVWSPLGRTLLSQYCLPSIVLGEFIMLTQLHYSPSDLPGRHLQDGKEAGGAVGRKLWGSLPKGHLENKVTVTWLLFGSFSWAAKMPPFKKTLAEFYSLISLLIKPSLLRCENGSRLVINC